MRYPLKFAPCNASLSGGSLCPDWPGLILPGVRCRVLLYLFSHAAAPPATCPARAHRLALDAQKQLAGPPRRAYARPMKNPLAYDQPTVSRCYSLFGCLVCRKNQSEGPNA